jgi:ribonuclease I
MLWLLYLPLLLILYFSKLHFYEDFLVQYSPDTCDPIYYRFSLLKKNNTFLIHGLWPQSCFDCSDCGFPSFCHKCSFNIGNLEPLFPRLQKDWFPGGDPRHNGLLTHEWCKHGTCTNMTDIKYFNTSLNIYDMLISKGLIQTCSDTCYFNLDHNLRLMP